MLRRPDGPVEFGQERPRPASRKDRRQLAYTVAGADWPELSLLPGVGETLARRIVESRSKHGRFADLDDLRRVRGIGPKTLERIRPFLRPLPPAANVAGQ
jgi:competence protein ComEA